MMSLTIWQGCQRLDLDDGTMLVIAPLLGMSVRLCHGKQDDGGYAEAW